MSMLVVVGVVVVLTGVGAALKRRRSRTPSGQWGLIDAHDRAMRAIAPGEPAPDPARDDDESST